MAKVRISLETDCDIATCIAETLREKAKECRKRAKECESVFSTAVDALDGIDFEGGCQPDWIPKAMDMLKDGYFAQYRRLINLANEYADTAKQIDGETL